MTYKLVYNTVKRYKETGKHPTGQEWPTNVCENPGVCEEDPREDQEEPCKEPEKMAKRKYERGVYEKSSEKGSGDDSI
ncbi:Hypothetical protein FKW44_016797 [Caligus rogercresseyi]|uniref:Uncharacterized protein n=1 Tax=Caligus rogercresseyi TaxID=217165 RepID=A0A7T8K0Q4_CALRO|nr:Hypothetical protein FKW44_016797 [Caligus rogercresseyi]